MPYRKFGDNDVFVNTMRAHPQVDFLVFDGKAYYNNIPEQSGSLTDPLMAVGPGHINLHEMNVDRPLVSTGRFMGDSALPDNGRIYSYINKSSTRVGWKTVTAASFDDEFEYASIITSSYPQVATITREYIATPYTSPSSFNAKYVSLRNKLNLYELRSEYYKVSGTFGDKDTGPINLISIPSIFYGTRIKPGSISLKWYFTGSLIGELKDENENGELIQVGPYGSTGSGSVAGVVLYDEGFFLLTGSWSLNSTAIPMTSGSTTASDPSWLYYSAGSNDGVTQTSTSGLGIVVSDYVSASFATSFKGQTDTQVMTMFAHARRGEVNYSNNPTFLEHGQNKTYFTSSNVYEQTSSIKIKNIVSSSYSDYSAPFKRQVYISKIGIYDENKNLIGVATLSNPVLKEEGQDISFKMKIDV
tara:strand:- start:462 stop:1709 length:1248 start_codon:yes stop_codon:yes gene_type:complete